MSVSNLYQANLSMLTDLYQLTMSYGYWKADKHQDQAAFHLFYRKAPFGGEYAIVAGLDYAVEVMKNFHFSSDDIEYLATLTGNDGNPLFEQGFLDYLHNLKFTCDVDAMPEGTLALPNQPLLRIVGPIVECQILETVLLNIINFQTLVATKAARVVAAADGDSVLEFGLRRAQGIDGSVAASRAAYIGGCDATSNVLAGKLFDIPVKGTHAHSWVMSFSDEQEAFETYAAAMPNNCVFLVDTYDTLEGVKKAIAVGQQLADKGYRMAGIRLDSGDLAELSKDARELLDEAGFTDALIVASNDLDEGTIQQLKADGAKIAVWGVGTKLATAYDQPALGGVYKLAAIRSTTADAWSYRVKLSEDAIKVSNPGVQQVQRYTGDEGEWLADVLVNEAEKDDGRTLVDQSFGAEVSLPERAKVQYLLQPVFRQGQCVMDESDVHQSRQLALDELAQWQNTSTDVIQGLSVALDALKADLIKAH